MRRTLIISGLALLIVALLAAGYFFFVSQKTPGNGDVLSKDFFSAFFPFGSRTPSNNNQTPGETGAETAQKVTARLRQVSNRPTAGAWFASPATTTSSRIRFMERTTGHIFETPVDSYAETRLSNTTIPLIQDLVVINDSSLILRTLPDSQTISNAFAVLNATTSQQSLNTSPLKGFARVAVASSGLTLLTVTEVAGGSQIELAQPNGDKPRTILLSPIRSWVPLAGGTHFFIESAPSSGIPGFLYEIKADGSLIKVLGEIPGLLSMPSPTGRYVLYSSGAGNRAVLAMLDIQTGQNYLAPLQTLATKCAWVSEANPTVFCGISDSIDATASLPDDWMLGKIRLNDSAWLIRPFEGTAHSLGNFQEIAGIPIDVTSVSISPDQRYAIFINKNDLTLWSLDLTRDE